MCSLLLTGHPVPRTSRLLPAGAALSAVAGLYVAVPLVWTDSIQCGCHLHASP